MRSDRLLWIVLAALGIAALLLMFNDGSGQTLGLSNGDFASVIYLGSIALVVGAGVVARARFGGNVLTQIIIWLGIVLALVVGYKLYQGEPLFQRNNPLPPPASGAGISASLADGIHGKLHIVRPIDLG